MDLYANESVGSYLIRSLSAIEIFEDAQYPSIAHQVAACTIVDD